MIQSICTSLKQQVLVLIQESPGDFVATNFWIEEGKGVRI